MDQSAILFIVLAGAAFLLIGVLATHSGGSLNGIKAKTVGDGQHGTARWATKKELKQTYQYIPFRPGQWRKGENLPKPGIPEAMNVLLHELRGLALSVKLE